MMTSGNVSGKKDGNRFHLPAQSVGYGHEREWKVAYRRHALFDSGAELKMKNKNLAL